MLNVKSSCSRTTTRTPHGCIIKICTKERTERNKSVTSDRNWNLFKENPSRITRCLWLYFFFDRGSSWFVLMTQRAADAHDMLALANSVCMPAWSRSDRHVCASLLYAWLIALCCVLHARQHASSRRWVCFGDLSGRSRFKTRRIFVRPWCMRSPI